MKSTDLDSLKKAWKNEGSFEDRRLSEAEIENYLRNKSSDISRLFRKGLIFDIILKSIIGLSLLGLLFLLPSFQSLAVICSAILIILWGIRYQWRMISRIPETSSADPVIKTTLESKITFFRRHFIKSLYVGALSNSLFILSGMLYYFYFKYGEIRPLQWDDYLVFGLIMLLGFAFGAYVQIAHHNFQVKQLESSLQEIDEDLMSTLSLREQRNRKRRMVLAFVLVLVCGLLVLAYLIFR